MVLDSSRRLQVPAAFAGLVAFSGDACADMVVWNLICFCWTFKLVQAGTVRPRHQIWHGCADRAQYCWAQSRRPQCNKICYCKKLIGWS